MILFWTAMILNDIIKNEGVFMKRFFSLIIVLIFSSIAYSQDADIQHYLKVNYSQYFSINDISNFTITSQIGDFIQKNTKTPLFYIGVDGFLRGNDQNRTLSQSRSFLNDMKDFTSMQNQVKFAFRNIGPKNFKISFDGSLLYPSSIYSMVNNKIIYTSDIREDEYPDYNDTIPGDIQNWNRSIGIQLSLFDFLQLGIRETQVKLYTDVYDYLGLDTYGFPSYSSMPVESYSIDEKYYDISLNLLDLFSWKGKIGEETKTQIFNNVKLNDIYIESINSLIYSGWASFPFINIHKDNTFNYWSVSPSFLLPSYLGNLWVKPNFCSIIPEYFQSLELILDLTPVFSRLIAKGTGYAENYDSNLYLQSGIKDLFTHQISDIGGLLMMIGPGVKYTRQSPYFIVPNDSIKDQLSAFFTTSVVFHKVWSNPHMYIVMENTVGFNDPLVSGKYLYESYSSDFFSEGSLFMRFSMNLGYSM
jgi:hypothetical protein